MRKFVALTGGLGNQLFQVAGALTYTTEPVDVISCLGNPRKHNGELEISALNFGGQIVFRECQRTHAIAERMFAVMLSSATRRKFLQKNCMSRIGLSVLGSIIFSLHLRYPVYPRVSIGIGHDDYFPLKRGNLFIGYFQTYEMDDRARKILLHALDEVLPIRRPEPGMKPDLVIHSRLGDYKNERNFGVLNADYFRDAISSLEKEAEIRNIWLFSDEPNLALTLMPTTLRKKIEIIGGEDDAPTVVLKTMMEGNNFIISNSTFSWWSAFLANSESVIFPSPWFANGEIPNRLVPDHWKSINRN